MSSERQCSGGCGERLAIVTDVIPQLACNILLCRFGCNMAGWKRLEEMLDEPEQRNTRAFRKLACWWFGCVPDYSKGTSAIPCNRCGAFDVGYSDCVGDTRHNRMKARVLYWFWKRWFGGRSKDNPDVPF